MRPHEGTDETPRRGGEAVTRASPPHNVTVHLSGVPPGVTEADLGEALSLPRPAIPHQEPLSVINASDVEPTPCRKAINGT